MTPKELGLKDLGDVSKVTRRVPAWCGSAEAQHRRSRAVQAKRAKRKAVGDLSRCFYCGEKTARAFGPSQATLDHLKPTAAGGSDAPSNLVPSCYRCNLAKGSLFTVGDVLWVAYLVLKARLLLLGRAVDKRLASLRARCVNWLAHKGRT